MTQADPPRAVLDADIIFSRVLHDLMGRVADDLRLLDLLWSEELLAEARRSLVEKKGLSDEVARRWVGYLSEGLPRGDLDLRSLTADVEDLHVCALAMAGNADYLFTFDRAYLKAPLLLHGIEVPDPDGFLTGQCEEQPQAFRQTVEEQARDWRRGRPVEELLAAFERANVPTFAQTLRRLLDLPQ